jgi:hypothetical protein
MAGVENDTFPIELPDRRLNDIRRDQAIGGLDRRLDALSKLFEVHTEQEMRVHRGLYYAVTFGILCFVLDVPKLIAPMEQSLKLAGAVAAFIAIEIVRRWLFNGSSDKTRDLLDKAKGSG